MFYGYGEHVLVRIIAYKETSRKLYRDCTKMNRDKIGTQTCYIHQCTKRYVDVHSMSVSQSSLFSFLCNLYITLQIS